MMQRKQTNNPMDIPKVPIRFIPKKESSELFLTGLTGSTGAFLKGQEDFLGEQVVRKRSACNI